MDWIKHQWDQLTSIQDGDITPWTNLWRQANFFYTHNEHFWAEVTAILAGLTIAGVLLLAWLVSTIRSKFFELTPPVTSPEERKLKAILEAVKLIDESRQCLRRINATLKDPTAGTPEHPGTLSNGHLFVEHSEVTG